MSESQGGIFLDEVSRTGCSPRKPRVRVNLALIDEKVNVKAGLYTAEAEYVENS